MNMPLGRVLPQKNTDPPTGLPASASRKKQEYAHSFPLHSIVMMGKMQVCNFVAND